VYFNPSGYTYKAKNIVTKNWITAFCQLVIDICQVFINKQYLSICCFSLFFCSSNKILSTSYAWSGSLCAFLFLLSLNKLSDCYNIEFFKSYVTKHVMNSLITEILDQLTNKLII